MMPNATLPPATRPYSRAELLSDAVVHLTALALAVCAVPVLITLTATWHGSAPGVAGVSIYGVTLIAMITASLLYNHLPRPDLRDTLLRIDRSAIYCKIAGTYTPFALLSGAGTGLLVGLWAVALLGTAMNFLWPRRPQILGIAICLAMGWAVLIGARDLLATLSSPVIVLMVIGGTLYSLGTAFLMIERLPFHNTIWHVFVMSASVIFFVAIFLHAAQTT